MDGVFINGAERPRTKKALREAAAADPSSVMIEHTSVFDRNPPTKLSEAPCPTRYFVVGPDPYTNRQWYATITVLPNGRVKVS